MLGVISECLLQVLICTITTLTPIGSDNQIYAVCPEKFEVTQFDVSQTRMVVHHEYDSPLISYDETFVLICPRSET